ncbi:transcriptional regulator, TetR family [Microbacterium sp. ru370.1]|uniref:TetR/AcrR family transcriptional regulator n=1 Tax=unclassified Microbacterium TaxID=2609290 RepID=UPI00088FE59D|nr:MULTISPECIES: TetR/AcrR family transcriptional regulator [unclassified Microbacterium]SDO48025.1 transcriptional regulator, TetR family [Microbacterium sp. ru370.1]SIT82311.1 transcriptional regulator, TetR family [Microbacterium sp. RU1D]
MPTPERTSTERIVRAAVRLLEDGGPAAVTMQAVANAVGVKAPSLYKRVRDRDALLRLVGEEAADDLTRRLEAASGRLDDALLAFRDFGRERPEAFRLLFTNLVDADRLAATSAPVLRATEAAVGPAHALDAARLLTAWATGFVTMELAGAFRLGGDLDEAYRYGISHLMGTLQTAQEPERPAQGS